MERKIGEIFNYDGEWYQCLKSASCDKCAFLNSNCIDIPNLKCSVDDRKDHCSVVFKKLEKVGEPYVEYLPIGGIRYFQRYKCYQKPIYNGNFICWSDDISISIEIKNKEDMEENNNTKHSNFENIGKNLKPFDLQAAKSGKPVCTRDGKKARIICFDMKGEHSIVALTEEEDNTEKVGWYYDNGKYLSNGEESPIDLMMLPEKKEGWVNVYKDPVGKVVSTQIVFSSEETAKQNINSNRNYISTVKIEWYE